MPPTKIPFINIEKLKISANRIGGSSRMSRRKLKILQRDNFKCTKCSSNKELTIAHLKGVNPIGRARNAAKYDPKKCITLCVKCHLNYDFGV